MEVEGRRRAGGGEMEVEGRRRWKGDKRTGGLETEVEGRGHTRIIVIVFIQYEGYAHIDRSNLSPSSVSLSES